MTTKYQDDLAVKKKTGIETQRPRPHAVAVLNDDYTPMDFVVGVLSAVFKISADKAYAHMMQVHKNGKSLIGSFTFEVAETKATEVVDYARQAGHPLMAKPEPA